MQRWPSLAAVVLALALLATGCGSKKPPTTAEWVDGVCSSINTWASSVKSAVDPLMSGNLSENSLKTAGDDVKSATDTLKSDVNDLGKPDTQVGQQAKDSVDKLASTLEANADSVKSAVDDVSGIGGVASAAATVSATFTTMKSQITSTVNSLKELDPKGELQSAFQQSTACQQLSSSS